MNKTYEFVDGVKLRFEVHENGSLTVEELGSGDKMFVPSDIAVDFLKALKGIEKEEG